MKKLNAILAFAATVAMFFTSRAADVELLPAGSVRIGLGPNNSQRIAVDVSANLAAWKPLTNVVAAAGEVTFANDPLQSDPMRFFRIADGDDTFAVAGYVDGGAFLGGMAGVTVTEELTGTTTTTDANGFFHFNQRFARTNLPIAVHADAEGLLSARRIISTADSGSLAVLSMPYGGSVAVTSLGDPSIPTNPTQIAFNVTGGARAGLQFSIRLHDALASLKGPFEDEGSFSQVDGPPFNYVITTTSPTVATNKIFIFPVHSSFFGGSGYFSGIPGTNGTLAGNGTITWTNEIAPDALPVSLNGLAFSLGAGHVQFTNNVFALTWNGADYNGTFVGATNENTWRVFLTPNFSVESTVTIILAFNTKTNGTYTLAWPGQQTVSGAMTQIPYLSTNNGGGGEPVFLSSIRVAVSAGGAGEGAQYIVYFSGGLSGTFTTSDDAGQNHGSGTYTYTSTGALTAQLNMNYGGDFIGDFDRMSLTFKAPAGSPQPSSFTGTQQVTGTIYPFTGTFTY